MKRSSELARVSKTERRREDNKGRHSFVELAQTLEVISDTNLLHIQQNRFSRFIYCCCEIHTAVILSETRAFHPER